MTARKPGERVERYEIESLLGTGGMGEVYVALDTRLGRRVALKVLAPAAPGASEASAREAAERMLREARAAAAFDHANAVSVFDVGEVDGTPYIAMELVAGKTLRAFVGRGEPDWQTRLRWLSDAARALGAAHARHLVHRDVKPDNVMVRDDGVVKVLDFGIARRAPGSTDPSAPTQAANLPTLTAKGEIIGTPRYMAPEQLKDEGFDGRTDQFAWGVMAFELLSGRTPWSGGDNALAVTASIIGDEPPPLESLVDGLPADVARAVRRTLAKRPADRFARMEELCAALAPFAAAPTDGGAGAALATPREPIRTAHAATASMSPPPRSGKALVLVFVGLTAGFATAIWWAAQKVRPGEPPVVPQRTVTTSSTRAVTSSVSSAATSAPSSRAAVARRGPLRAPCIRVPAFRGDACKDDFVAWCDPSGQRIACCKKGLAATGVDGICACPPGGGSEDTDPSCARKETHDEARSRIQETFRAVMPRIQKCYEEALARSPKASGKMAFRVIVTPDGDVFSATIESASLPDGQAQACALAVVRTLELPAPRGTMSEIVYPIVLTPGD